MVEVVNEREKQHHTKSMHCDRDHKPLDLFNRKSYWSATLQFRIAIYQALMEKYNHTNYTKLNSFIEHLPAEHRKQFQAITTESQLLARTSLHAFLGAADTAAHSISTMVVVEDLMASALRISKGGPEYSQRQTFLLMSLSCSLTAFPAHVKRPQGTLCSLGIYIPIQKRKFSRSQTAQRSHSAQFSSLQRSHEPKCKWWTYQRRKPFISQHLTSQPSTSKHQFWQGGQDSELPSPFTCLPPFSTYPYHFWQAGNPSLRTRQVWRSSP